MCCYFLIHRESNTVYHKSSQHVYMYTAKRVTLKALTIGSYHRH